MSDASPAAERTAVSAEMPAVDLTPGQRLHGFTVHRVDDLPSLRARAIRLNHDRSGADVLHVVADDPENLIAIALRTPPHDDTGLPHILEHTVLCGSKRFPVKDPFVEMIKTSLATFINAMTYPDKTVYPVSSMVEADFYNLAKVYCDAVFDANVTEMHFKQEGHHLKLEEPGNLDSPLTRGGIVFNEMKGAYSDLDGIMFRHAMGSVCPDNAYGCDSGGDPDKIPELTYPDFLAFYRRLYHPSNSRIFFYGNLPTAKHLEFLDTEYLSRFDKLDIDTRIADQPRWREPRRESLPYPIGPDENPERKTAVVLTFLANELTDAQSTLAMNVLDYALLGHEASPLRKALIDSQLGEELTDSGYGDFQRDTLFFVGLKGSEPERADAIEKLVLETCRKLADEGLPKDDVEAAFHNLELATKQVGSHWPLRLMGRAMNSWLYDADPLHHLRIEEHLAELRRRWESEPRLLEDTLRRLIAENPHYTVYTFTPDKQYNQRREEAFRQGMAAKKAELSQQELQAIDEQAQALEAMQEEPNPPEALATLPRLSRNDVPEEPIELDTEVVQQDGGLTLLRTDTLSNGVSYLRLSFDLSGLDDELFDELSLYCDAVEKMGANGLDYVEMARREAAVCGGVSLDAGAGSVLSDPFTARPRLTVVSHALDEKLPQMLDVLAERALRPDLSDLARFRDVVMQGRVARRSDIIDHGSSFASLYAARHLSSRAALNERLDGFTEVRRFDTLADGFDSHRDAALEKLERIRRFVAQQAPMTVSFVGSDASFDRVREHLARYEPSGRSDGPTSFPEPDPAIAAGVREGVATPADVAFCARSLRTVGQQHEAAPALMLVGLQLRFGFLWEQLRVKGGAYGANASYNPASGVFAFSSYRDPHIKHTLEAFDGVFDHVAEAMDLSPDALTQAVIGTMKTLDRPIRPAQAAAVALGRFLAGETREDRKRLRQNLLSLRGEQVRAAVFDVLKPAYDAAPVCVLSSREKLESENAKLPESARLKIETL